MSERRKGGEGEGRGEDIRRAGGQERAESTGRLQLLTIIQYSTCHKPVERSKGTAKKVGGKSMEVNGSQQKSTEVAGSQ